jgi:hypothetical protein
VLNLSANSNNVAPLAAEGQLINALVVLLNDPDTGLDTKTNAASVLSNLALSPDGQVTPIYSTVADVNNELLFRSH